MTKNEIINKMKEYGYEYKLDGSEYSHLFYKKEMVNERNYDMWCILIEDYTDCGLVDEKYLIHSWLDQDGVTDWYGHKIEEKGCCNEKVLRLIMGFIDALEEEREENK